MVCTGCSYPLRHRRWPWIALGTRILFMVAMCIQIDGFVLLKVAGSIKTVHERGISLSGTWRMLEEAFNAGAEISVQLIFLGTLEELLFASMGQNMASSDGTTSTTARWSSSASFLSSPDDFSVRSLMRTSNPEKFFRFGDAEDLRLLEKQCNAGRSEG